MPSTFLLVGVIPDRICIWRAIRFYAFIFCPPWLSHCARDLTAWTWPVDDPFTEWRCLASALYVHPNLSTNTVFSSVKIRWVGTSDGNIIDVSINRIGEYLPPMSVLACVGRFPYSSHACQIRQRMRISGQLPRIQMHSKTRLSYSGGRLKCWIYGGGRGAAIYWYMLDHQDCPFICMDEKLDHKHRLSIMIARYVCCIHSDDFRTFSLVPVWKLCCLGRLLGCCWFKPLS